MDGHWLPKCFHFVRKRGKIDESSGSDKWAAPQHQELPVKPVLSTSHKRPTIFIYTFLTSRLEFESEWRVVFVYFPSLSGLLTFQYQKHTQQYARGKIVEKNLHIIFFTMQVEFVLSVSGGINPSEGKLVMWHFLVKSKLSTGIHSESTNNRNGWITNQ